MHHAEFESHGIWGYTDVILVDYWSKSDEKPDWLHFPFQIISAQQLPKINTEKASSIVDPQVWVEIHGVAIDNARRKTQRINNNGKSEAESFTVKHWKQSLDPVLLTIWIF